MKNKNSFDWADIFCQSVLAVWITVADGAMAGIVVASIYQLLSLIFVSNRMARDPSGDERHLGAIARGFVRLGVIALLCLLLGLFFGW